MNTVNNNVFHMIDKENGFPQAVFCAIENLQVTIRVKKNVKKVRGMSEVAFGLGQEILQRLLRI